MHKVFKIKLIDCWVRGVATGRSSYGCSVYAVIWKTLENAN